MGAARCGPVFIVAVIASTLVTTQAVRQNLAEAIAREIAAEESKGKDNSGKVASSSALLTNDTKEVATETPQTASQDAEPQGNVSEAQAASDATQKLEGEEQKKGASGGVLNSLWSTSDDKKPDANASEAGKTSKGQTGWYPWSSWSSNDSALNDTANVSLDNKTEEEQLAIVIERISNDKKFWKNKLHMMSTAGTIYLLLCALVYANYKSHPSEHLRNVSEFEGRQKFVFGLCPACLEDPGICLVSILFPTIRWADTIRMAGIHWFSTAFLIIITAYIGMATVNDLLGFGYFAGPGWLIPAALMTFYRQQVRAKFGLPQDWAHDIVAYICCSFCAIAQEARQLEEAYVHRHPAVYPAGKDPSMEEFLLSGSEAQREENNEAASSAAPNTQA